MGWVAAEKLGEALDETKELLTPFDAGTWARLWLIVLLTGTGMGFPNMPTSGFQTDSSSFSSTGASPDAELQGATSQVPDALSAPTALATGSAGSPGELAALIVGGALFLGLILFLVVLSSTMEYVLYRVLDETEVRIRSNFIDHLRRGAGYAVFRSVFILGMLAVVGGAIALAFFQPIAGIAAFVAAIPVFILVSIFLGLVNNFGVPESVRTGKGILSSVRGLLPRMRAEWREIGIYVLVRFAVRLVLGIFGTLLAVVVAIPLVLVFGIPAFLLRDSVILAAPIAAVGLLLIFVALVTVQIPLQVFKYYHALLTYDGLFGQ
jgi:hypothetical protein